MIDEKSSGQATASGIHPAPSEFSPAQIANDPVLHYFHYAHLPPKLQSTSRNFFLLAQCLVGTLPRNPERTVALRKLLEAKDAAVRANLPPPGMDNRKSGVASEQPIGEPREIQNAEIDRDGPIKFDG